MVATNILTVFLHIAGAAALLIWSVRLVRTGVERAFTVQLRLWLRRSTKSRALAAMTGTASAMLLQSATAVAIMVSGFVSGGTILAATGLAILLGNERPIQKWVPSDAGLGTKLDHSRPGASATGTGVAVGVGVGVLAGRCAAFGRCGFEEQFLPILAE